MAAERCPLCQSKLKNGECGSCGYRLPDEGGISAYYNYDPSDYPQEQPAVREITPEYQMEEIYPNRPEPIDFKVRDDQGKTVPAGSPYQSSGQNGQQQAGQYGGQNAQQGQPYYRTNSPYGQYRQQGQYGGRNGQQGQPYYRNNSPYGQYHRQGQYGGRNGQQPYNQTYYGNNGQYPYSSYKGGYQPNGNNPQGAGNSVHLTKKHWQALIATFLLPFPIGMFIFLAVLLLSKTGLVNIDPKFRKMLIAALILGFIFSPFGWF